MYTQKFLFQEVTATNLTLSTLGCGARPVCTGSRRRRTEWTKHVVVASVLVHVRIAWGENFHRLNVSETATHVTGHYVSQQCQMRMRSCTSVQPCPWNLLRSTYTLDVNKRTQNFWKFWQNSLKSSSLLNYEIWSRQAAALPFFFHFIIFSSKFNRTSRWEGTRTFVRMFGSAAPCIRIRGQ
jgi:hypothetical protein